ATGVWTQAGAHPPIPYTRGVGGSPNCKDPRDERVYCATYATAERFDGTTNSWTRVIDRSQLGESAQDVAIMGIDTVHNKLFRLGLTGTGGYLTPGTMDLTSLAYTRVATLVGPYASTFPVGSPNAYIGGAGLCFDPGLGKFLLYRAYGDDGFIYTFEYVSDLQWRCDRLTLAGTPPPIDQSASRGYFLGGSMQYCQELGGFAIIKRADLNVYFVKTV
ncbi:MAG: hypothetical protein ACREMY_17310, partial [bacterium]